MKNDYEYKDLCDWRISDYILLYRNIRECGRSGANAIRTIIYLVMIKYGFVNPKRSNDGIIVVNVDNPFIKESGNRLRSNINDRR